jgi:hypothetical protein
MSHVLSAKSHNVTAGWSMRCLQTEGQIGLGLAWDVPVVCVCVCARREQSQPPMSLLGSS